MIIQLLDGLYRWVGLPLADLVLFGATLVSTKARDRRSLARRSEHLHDLPAPSQHRLWFHAASMGEFEQLVPVIMAVREQAADVSVVVTLTSPSGLAHARATPGVDAAYILPPDTPRSMQKWFDRVQPTMVVIDRYDVWRMLVLEADARNVPVVLVNATMPTGARMSLLRSWYADTYRRIRSITAVTDKDGRELAELTGRTDIAIDTDTRVDRVIQRLSTPDGAVLAYGRSDVTTIVLGSSWAEDEDLIFSALQEEWSPYLRLIIVPHEPSEDELERIESKITCTRWSRSTPETTGHLVVDRVGLLLSIYAIADAAFVGGGFGAGVHSVTEPAGYALPIACGPRITRSRDAVALHEAGALLPIETVDDAIDWISNVVDHEGYCERASTLAASYIKAHRGASKRYAERITALW
ncbi:MAG: hypothetical protein EHM43_06420 [Ignavibacteriae bacterium]|nr:MAG: hypothetical protein EHM43_06420 [Ignavibacteriota bacterium]